MNAEFGMRNGENEMVECLIFIISAFPPGRMPYGLEAASLAAA
jgi:hypothetical protein